MYKSNCIHQYKVVPPYLAKLVNIASPSLVLMVINNDYRVNSAYKLVSCKLTQMWLSPIICRSFPEQETMVLLRIPCLPQGPRVPSGKHTLLWKITMFIFSSWVNPQFLWSFSTCRYFDITVMGNSGITGGSPCRTCHGHGQKPWPSPTRRPDQVAAQAQFWSILCLRGRIVFHWGCLVV